MHFLFTFCDCHWLIPWLLPFILGFLFGARLVAHFRSRANELESRQLRDAKRISGLEEDISISRAQLSERDNDLSAVRERAIEIERDLHKAQEDLNLKNLDLRKARQKTLESQADLALTKGKIYEIEDSGLIGSIDKPSSTSSPIGLKAAASTVGVSQLVPESEDANQNKTEEKAGIASTEEFSIDTGTTEQDAQLQVADSDKIGGTVEDTQAEIQNQVEGSTTDENSDLLSKINTVSEDVAHEEDTNAAAKASGLGLAGLTAAAKIGSQGVGSPKPTADQSTSPTATPIDKAVESGKTQSIPSDKTKSVPSDKTQEIRSYKSKAIISDKTKAIASDKTITTSTDRTKLQSIDSVPKTTGTSTARNQPKKKTVKYLESGFKPAATGKFQNVKEDDLTIIEGLGPKTAENLKSLNIKTWEDLASKSPGELKELLISSGSRFSHIDPATWPRQANLAAGNHWTRLEKLQDQLDGGKPVKTATKSSTASKAKAKATPIKAKAKATPAKTTAKAKAKANPKANPTKAAAKAKTVKQTAKKPASKAKSTSLKAKKIKSATKKTTTSGKKPMAKKAASGKKLTNKKSTAPNKKTAAKKVKAKTQKRSSKKTAKVSSKQKISVGKAIKSDNLEVIEGIGPKMNALLKKEGIKSWSNLASYSPAEIRTVLEKHGDRYKIIDVRNWPKQASYAAKDQWSKLIQYQKKDGSDSKAEKILVKTGVLKKYKSDDFKIIEGIGPKIESLLKDANIKTWSALAKTSKSKLSAILNKAGKRYGLADPSTWPKQAGLAASGKFDKLEALQKKI